MMKTIEFWIWAFESSTERQLHAASVGHSGHPGLECARAGNGREVADSGPLLGIFDPGDATRNSI